MDENKEDIINNGHSCLSNFPFYLIFIYLFFNGVRSHNLHGLFLTSTPSLKNNS